MNKNDEEFQERRHAMIAHKIAWICTYIVMFLIVSEILDIIFGFITYINIDALLWIIVILFFFLRFYVAWFITHHFLGKYSWG